MNTYQIEHGGEVAIASEAELPGAIEALKSKHGAWGEASRVVLVSPAPPALALAMVPAPAPDMVGRLDKAAPSRMVRPVGQQGAPTALAARGVTVDREGADRSRLDRDTALLSGFAPKRPIYARGTMVRLDGVERGQTLRREYEALPAGRDAMASLWRGIKSEEREDLTLDVASLRMREDGTMQADGAPLVLTRGAFPRLLSRVGLGCAAEYLSMIAPDLRAVNVNRWLDGDRVTGGKLKLRTRKGAAGREVFAVVSERYASFDPDLLAHAIAKATADLPGARADVTYDGARTSVEVLWHTTVQPEKFVAGEYFRAGVSLRTDDTGQGGIRGSAVLFQNLCLNLIIVDQAETGLFAVRHSGRVDRVAEQIRIGLERAADAVAPFVERWNGAAREDLAKEIPAEVPEARGLTLSDLMRGTFRDLVERELVPARGRTEEQVTNLYRAWGEDRSGAAGPTRATVVNAITREAHQRGGDPWAREEDERAASRLLWSEEPLRWRAEPSKG